MAEARRGRDPQLDERVGIRHGIKPGTKVSVELIRERLTAELLDFSLEGCALALPASLDPSTTAIQVHLEGVLRAGPHSGPCFGWIRSREVREDGRLRCGIKFDPVLSQSIFSRFDQVVTGLTDDTRTRRKHFEIQRVLALRDLEDLRAANRQQRLMQLQILLMGVPILLVLLGPTTSYLLGTGASPHGIDPPWWMLALPLGSLLFSFLLYTVFLHLAMSVTRQGSFALILERGLAESCLPPGYRGWSDAHAHLQRSERLRSDAHTAPTADSRLVSGPEDWPALPLLQATTATFVAILIGSLVLMWWLAITLEISISAYTLLVAFSTLLVVIFLVGARRFRQRLRSGDRSFRHFYVRFERVLALAGPYDVAGAEAD